VELADEDVQLAVDHVLGTWLAAGAKPGAAETAGATQFDSRILSSSLSRLRAHPERRSFLRMRLDIAYPPPWQEGIGESAHWFCIANAEAFVVSLDDRLEAPTSPPAN
jgi:hypothetical protein